MSPENRAVLKLSLLLALCLGVISCSSFRNGSPPTKLESSLFSVTTNQVPIVTPGGVTNGFQPVYTYGPGHVLKDVETGVSLIPGYGGLAGTALGALAAVWGWVRSSKNGTTAVTLAQSVEAMREFVKALPNGATYDSALTTWLQSHQNDTGTVNQVLSLLENDVSNPDAKAAAQQVIAAINSLNPSALPPGTSVKL